MTLPAPDPDHQLFWSLTLYDNQTRSMLPDAPAIPPRREPAVPTPAATPSQDGATTIVMGPQRPATLPAGNWIQTLPGQGWFVILRLYSPAEPFFDKSWRPGRNPGWCANLPSVALDVLLCMMQVAPASRDAGWSHLVAWSGS